VSRLPKYVRDLAGHVVRVSQHIVGSEPDDRPARLAKRIETGDIPAKLLLLAIVVAFVLDGHPPLRVGQVDPADEPADAIEDAILRRRCGSAW
jgi:hypothetical protein